MRMTITKISKLSLPCKSNLKKIVLLFSFLTVLGSASLFSSTGEGQGRVLTWNKDGADGKGSLNWVITRINHMSFWADPPYGDTVSSSDFSKAIVFIDGVWTNWETVKDAVVPDQNFYIHNNRAWYQIFSIQTWDPVIEGEIVNVDNVSNELTVRYELTPEGRVRHNPEQPGYIDSVMQFDPSTDVIKYEGEEMDASSAIQIGRHARVYPERKQTLSVFTPEALAQDPRQPYKNATGDDIWKAFVQQGFFKGYYGPKVYFSENRDGEWINSFRDGQVGRMHLLGADMIKLDGALLRPGDRTVFVPYAQPSEGLESRFLFVRPNDENNIEGTIVAVSGNDITLEVISCPTGEASDIDTSYVNITLDADAVFHLNGIKNQPQTEVLQVGNYVRLMNAWTGAVLARDIDVNKVKLNEQPPTKPYFVLNQLFAPGNEPHFQPAPPEYDTINVIENNTARFKIHPMSTGETTYQWYQDGALIPGAQGMEYLHLAFMKDHGSEFTLEVTNQFGTVTSPPIILTVEADTSKLLVEGASVADNQTIQLMYNKQVDKATAENLTNYSIDQGVSINDITLIGDLQTVILKTSVLTAGSNYEITVNNVIDLSETPNQLADNTIIPVSFRVAFRYFRYTTIEKLSGLNPRIKWMRFFEDDVAYGEGRNYFGVGGNSAAVSYDGFHSPNSASVSNGDGIGLDMQPGNEIAPDSVMIEIESASGRDIRSWKIEASNDMENWTLMYESNAQDTMLNGRTYCFPFDLSGLSPEDILTGAKTAQTIDFPQIPTRDMSESPFSLQATATSGLPLTYFVLSGPAVVSGDQLTLTDTGTVWIRAVQEGNDTYYSAYPQEQTFKVVVDEKTDQTITFDAVANPTEVSSFPAVISLSATASSGLIVSYELVSGDASVSGNQLTVNSAGSVTVKAMQTGNHIYKAAPEEEQTFQVDLLSDVNTHQLQTGYSVHPNPTTGIVYVGAGEKVQVRVYNAVGSLIQECDACNKVDLSTTQAGLYFIEVDQEMHKVIKQ